ncbi:MAG: GSCFA domain-containing protein [Cyanobacteria bacterium J06638_7]
MGKNPYSNLPKSAFWKTGVAQENPYAIEGIYNKKFTISSTAKIATAGSCFAQHITRRLKTNGYNVMDVEPPPPLLPEDLHQKFGFSMYSARYGNIYTVRQLLQLALEVAGEWSPKSFIWEKGDKFYDGLRPAVEPEGLDTREEVVEHRKFHLQRVHSLFRSMDLFIFTLGLTEMWVHKDSGTVFPTAPGALAGEFDERVFDFRNAHFGMMKKDFNQFLQVLRKIRAGRKFKMILTVSPVPLTATASGRHVLTSTTYSKSTLRSIAGFWAQRKPFIDYFPSYEIVINPRLQSTSFSDNLRSVKDEAVDNVMRHFFSEHPIINSKVPQHVSTKSPGWTEEDVQCEEAMLEVFGQ